MQTPGQRVTPQVKAHLSVLLAALALLKGVAYWLQRYELTFSTRGFVNGAGYTDVKAQLPAINLLILISFGAAVLLIVNIWRRGWVLPVIAVGLWAFVAVVAGAAYPAFIQRFQVEPAESTKELPYIARNIEATPRCASDSTPSRPRTSRSRRTSPTADLTADDPTLQNVRLLDPNIVLPTFQRVQGIRSYYQFNDLDVDRYTIDGKHRAGRARRPRAQLVPTSRRTPGRAGISRTRTGTRRPRPRRTTVTVDGRPDFVVKDLPPDGRPSREPGGRVLRREPRRRTSSSTPIATRSTTSRKTARHRPRATAATAA